MMLPSSLPFASSRFLFQRTSSACASLPFLSIHHGLRRFLGQRSAASKKPSSFRHSATEDMLTQHMYSPSPFKLLRSSPSDQSLPSPQAYPQLSSLGFLPEITEAMQTVILQTGEPASAKVKPTEIQVLASQHFFKTPSTPMVLAAETGSGKTLAYLACLFEQLKRDEREFAENPLEFSTAGTGCAESKPMDLRRLERPRALVLVPTLDLLEQVGSVAKRMSHHAKLRVVTMSTSTPATHLKRMWSQPVDVLVTTPGTLDRWKERLGLAETRFVVLDEADFLLDQGFEREAKQTFQLLSRIAETRQRPITLCFATATVPLTLLQTLQRENIDAVLLATSHLHRSPPSCKHLFLDTKDRYAKLRSVLQEFHQNQTLIFCNTKDEVERVYVYLRKSFPANIVYKCLGLQTLEERRLVWQQFQVTGILVCTDLVSRGLDTPCSLVINHDFPRSALEYLHRSGRTARAGKKGQVVSLVTHKNQTLVKAIRQRLARKQDLAVARWVDEKKKMIKKKTEVNEKVEEKSC